MSVRIELDTIRKHRNAKEYRPINRARCGSMEQVGDGAIIQRLCANLLAHHDPETVVHVYRNGTLCFRPESLSVWASGKLGRGEQPSQLRRGA